ncbi:MAG: DUF2619 domain-containing protein [Peptococcaceae bacterium]|nr:DUF2619 domain-containing protein [Peptococcaceae bacterium]
MKKAFRINAVMGMTWPSVMLTVTTLGLTGLAGKISIQGIFIVVMAGVGLIFLGVSLSGRIFQSMPGVDCSPPSPPWVPCMVSTGQGKIMGPP